MYLQCFCSCLKLPESKPEQVQAEVWAAAKQCLQGLARYPPQDAVRCRYCVMLKTSLQQEVLQSQHCARSCNVREDWLSCRHGYRCGHLSWTSAFVLNPVYLLKS